MEEKNNNQNIARKYRGGYSHIINNMYLEMQLIKHVNDEKPRVLETSDLNENVVTGDTYEEE